VRNLRQLTGSLLFAGAALSLTACPGPYQQQKLQADVDGLKRELVAIRAETRKGESDLALRSRLADLGASLEQLRTDISLLQGRLESMQDASSKTANDQLKVRQDIEIRIATLDEQVRALQAKIEQMKVAAGANPGPTPVSTTMVLAATPVPVATATPATTTVAAPTPKPTAVVAPGKESDQQMYQRGAEALDGKRYADARAAWTDLLGKHPKSEYADNARYWIGESYYAEKDFASAILEFDKVVRDYPAGDKVAAALLKQGLAFLEIGEKEGGVATLQDVVKKYPKSEEAKKAKERLQKLK
jgi:tol-pal system protein YbgF